MPPERSVNRQAKPCQASSGRAQHRLLASPPCSLPGVPPEAPARCCDNFLYGFKGAPSARQADRPRPRLAKDAQDVYGGREQAGQCRAVAARGGGDSRRRWRAAWPTSSCAIAHRRGPLPAAPMPRAPPQHAPRRNAPWVTRSASWPGRSSRVRCADRRTKDHSHGAGTPRIVRVGPSSVKGTRRAFLTASQKRSSGPTLERRRPLPTQRA